MQIRKETIKCLYNMKKFFISLILFVFGVGLFAQDRPAGSGVDYEYNKAVSDLFSFNFERPSYKMNFAALRESLVEMHKSMSIPGEDDYIARNGISRSVFVQNCVDEYFDTSLPKDYANLVAPFLKRYVSRRDIEILVGEMNDPELRTALIRLEGMSTSIDIPDESFWNDAIMKIAQGLQPNTIPQRYCPSNYKALFEDYYMVSNTDMMVEAMINAQLVGVEEMKDPTYAEIIRKYKQYMLSTIKTIALNFCLDSSINERDLQICVNYNSLPEYQSLSHGLVAAMSDMANDSQRVGNEVWTMYSSWVSRHIANQEVYSFYAVELDARPTFQGGDSNSFSMWVNQRLVYPDIAKDNGVQGRVVLKFMIDEYGRVCDIVVLRGVDPALDAEAVRVVSSSPRWTPGYMGGKPVRVTYTFPVIFQLQ